jgi:two-component system, sensor histidine kinase PdtaS
MPMEESHRLIQWWTRVKALQLSTRETSTPLEGVVRQLHDELCLAWEELQAYEEEVVRQQEALVTSLQDVEVERQRSQELFDLVPTAYLITDAHGTIHQANRAAGSLLQRPPTWLEGKPLRVLLAHEAQAAWWRQLAQLQAGQGVDGWEMQLQRKNQPPVVVACSVAPARDPKGEVVRLHWVLDDLTAHKRLEAHLQAEVRAKEVLLTEVQHRMKNHLQLILSLLDLQAEMSSDAKVRAILEDSQQRIQTIGLLHEFLSPSRDLAQVNMADYLQRLSTQLAQSHTATSQRLTLTCELEAVVLPVQTAVSCGLILNELLSNALKHAFPRGQHGEVTIMLREAPPGTAMLTVRDTGRGFPEGIDFRTTGSLGLQVVSLLAEQLGGQLDLTRGQGTQFTLTFPFTSVQKGTDGHIASPGPDR